jgi:hypothetical protein
MTVESEAAAQATIATAVPGATSVGWKVWAGASVGVATSSDVGASLSILSRCDAGCARSWLSASTSCGADEAVDDVFNVFNSAIVAAFAVGAFAGADFDGATVVDGKAAAATGAVAAAASTRDVADV